MLEQVRGSRRLGDWTQKHARIHGQVVGKQGRPLIYSFASYSPKQDKHGGLQKDLSHHGFAFYPMTSISDPNMEGQIFIWSYSSIMDQDKVCRVATEKQKTENWQSKKM